MKNRDTLKTKEFTNIINVVKQLTNKTSNIVLKESIQQKDGYNCGRFVLLQMWKICQHHLNKTKINEINEINEIDNIMTTMCNKIQQDTNVDCNFKQS